MKQKALVIFSMFCSGTVIAQEVKPENLPKFDTREFNFGFMISFNQAGYELKESNTLPDTINVNVKNEPGFNLGIIACVRLNKNVCFRFNPGLSFEERRLYYYNANKMAAYIGFRTQQSTYLNFPLHLKLSTNRIHNMQPYILGGAFYSIDMACSKTAAASKVISELDHGYGLGMGVDLYCPYFKLGVELKYNGGAKNILVQQNNFVTAPLESIKTRSFVFSLTFEG